MQSVTNLSKTYLFAGAIVLAFILRVVISWYSIGSNDATLWKQIADYIAHHGLSVSYATIPLNHPPLAAQWSVVALWLADQSDWSFFFIFRLPAIMADLGCCVLLWIIYAQRSQKAYGWMAAALYAWCVDALLLSSYHGNTDSIYAFLGLLAAYLIDRHRAFGMAGLALAAAINVKLIPILLIMPFYAACTSRRDAALLTCGLAVGAIPFIWQWALSGVDFYNNVVGYNSQVDLWGVTIMIGMIGDAWSIDDSSHIVNTYAYYGRYIILLVVALLSYIAHQRRRWTVYETGAMAMAIFLILVPGFGIQYTVAVLPLLCAARLWMGVMYGAVSGAFILSYYGIFWTGTVPIHSYFTEAFPKPVMLLGFAAYLLLIQCAIRLWRRR